MAKRNVSRLLPVKVEDSERLEIGITLSELIAKREGVDAEAKEVAQRFKDDLTYMRTQINHMAQVVETGVENREVKCHWLYHTPDRGNKSLYRDDTDELVEIKDMVEADYQMLADEQQLQLSLT